MLIYTKHDITTKRPLGTFTRGSKAFQPWTLHRCCTISFEFALSSFTAPFDYWKCEIAIVLNYLFGVTAILGDVPSASI